MADEVFIERRFELKPGGVVTLRFFKPKPYPDECWRCAFDIDWPDRERFSRWAGGSDPVHAFKFAMMMAHMNLLVSSERRAGLLTWSGRFDLGLPLPASLKPEDFD